MQGKPKREGTGEAQEEWMQGFALKDGGLTFKAGPREGEIARLLDGDFTRT